MRRDRCGMAAIFDALLFLAVASVVSVALLGAFAEDPKPADRTVQEKVEAAHQVLLRSTLPGGAGNNVTVLEMAALEVRTMSSNRSTDLASGALPLLLPGMGFEWTVDWDGRTMTASAGPPGGSDAYCSLVEADLPWGTVVYRLRAWAL